MIKAIFPAGVTDITVNGLHQWDYGQKLEIHADDLPAVVEVHFSCAGMTEAVVRVCDVNDGVATAAIPDRCLEQTGPVTAWVYVINGTAGATTKTVLLPIIARTRPAATESVPEEYTDKYAEALTAMNAAAERMEAAVDGGVDAVIEGIRDDLNEGILVPQRSVYSEYADQASRAGVAEALSNPHFLHHCYVRAGKPDDGITATVLHLYVSFVSQTARSTWTLAQFKDEVKKLPANVALMATGVVLEYEYNSQTELRNIVALYHDGTDLYVKTLDEYAHVSGELGVYKISESATVTGAYTQLAASEQ